MIEMQYFQPKKIDSIKKLDIIKKGDEFYFVQNTRRYGQRVTLSIGTETKEFVSFENSPVKYGLIPIEYSEDTGQTSDWSGVFGECFLSPFFPTVKEYEQEKTLKQLQDEGFMIVGKVVWDKSQHKKCDG